MKFEINATLPFIHKMNGGAEKRATVNWPSAGLDVWFTDSGYQTSTAGVTVDASTALKHAAYWRAINLLSSQIASFPLRLFKRLPNGDTQEITDHPAVRLMTKKPNQITDPFIYRETMQANVLTWGNGYSEIIRDKKGDPVELLLMKSEDVSPRSDGRVITYNYLDRTAIDYTKILHIKGLCFDGVKGKAPIQTAAESIGLGLAMQKYSNNFFKNGAKQSGVLTHPLPLSENARNGLRTSFNKNIKDKEGGTMILDEGMKYQNISIPPDQQQLLQSKKFSVDDIARWFGIPPHLLFEESRSTFNNIAEQGISFVRYTLTQWVERWESELENKLLREEEKEDHFFKFNMDSLMRGNAKDRFESYRAGLDLGVYSINEVRRLEELNSIEGGDQHLVQLNKTTINNLGDGNEKV